MYTKTFLTVCVLCTLLYFTSFHTYSVIAQNATSSPMSTDVDTYNPGRLNGQDGWSSAWNSPTVQDAITFDGQTALQNKTDVGTASYKAFEDELFEAGVMSTKIRIDNNTFSDNQDIFGLYKGIGEEFVALFRFGNNFDNRTNTLLLSIAESADVREIGSFSQGQWHKISVGWRRSDFSLRVKIDDGTWSEWFSSQTSWGSNGPLGMKVSLPNAATYGTFYQDDIASFAGYEEPAGNALVVATSSTATDALRLLSINLSTTSLTANLDDGKIVTATFDGIVEVPTTSSATDTSATTTPIATTTEATGSGSLGSLIAGIVEYVVEIFTDSETEPASTEEETIPSDESSAASDSTATTEPATITTESEVTNEPITTTF